MNIKVSDLKKFQKLTAHIECNRILPASDCIRFGGGAIVKNVNSAFVSYACNDSTVDVLVDERSLNSLLNATASDFINISVKETKIILSDGRDKIPVGIVPLKDFGELPEPESKKLEITPEFLSILGQASEACAEMKAETSLYMFVHVGNKMMASGNGFMGVCFPIDEDYKMVIEKEVAKLVSRQQIYGWAESKGHYFFYGHDVFFGFSKQQIGFSNMGSMIRGGEERTFSISSADVLSFNSLALSLSFTKELTVVTMAPGQFETVKAGDEEPSVRPYEGLKVPEPFNYNPEYMNKVITALNVEELDFYHDKRAYFIKSPDTKATAIIAKISK